MTDLPHTRHRPFVGMVLALVLSLGASAAMAEPPPTPPVRELSGHTAGVTSVAVFPDGAHAVTGSRDRTVKIWDLRGARVERTLAAHKGAVLAVAVSRDGKRVASAGADKVVRVWDVSSGDLIAQLEGHTSEVVGVAFLPDGQVLSGATDGLRRWDVEKEETVWRSDPEAGGVFDMTVSADGSRAACVNYNSSRVGVWDLAARKRVAQFGGSGYLVPGLALSPDGREVIGHGGEGGHQAMRWDVASGKPLPLPEGFSAHHMTYSADGRLVAGAGLNGHADVWDTTAWREVASLGGVRAPMDTFLSVAFAPDGKSLAATTGFFFPENAPVHTSDGDKLFIFDLSDAGAAAQTGPKAGNLSWDEISPRVKLASGRTVELKDSPMHRSDVVARRLADGLDVCFQAGVFEGGSSLFLHRTAGLFEEVPVAPGAKLDDVVWDGKYIWAAARKFGLFVFDREGRPVAKVGDDQGLPPAQWTLKLHPLSPGRVLAAGVDGDREVVGGSGWCAIVRVGEGGGAAAPAVNVFLREPQLPPEWTAGMHKEQHAFRPKFITEPPATPNSTGNAARRVWVVCGNVPASDSPILVVDPDAATFTAYNVEAPNQRPRRTVRFPDTPAPYWLSSTQFMDHANYSYRYTLGEKGIDPGQRKLVVFTPWPNASNGTTPFLPIGDQVYLPGKRWHRIDPRTLAVEDVGPGLRIDGSLAEEDEVVYFVSGVVGPAALSVTKTRLYRISVDPAHPLATAATLDPPARGKPIPPEGAIEFVNGQTVFFCGEGAVWFANGKLVPDFRVTFPYRNPRAELDAEADRTRAILRRLSDRLGDNDRVGLTKEQMLRMNVSPRRDGPRGIDMKQVQAQYATWEAAAPGPAKDEAAKPLFAAARAAGEVTGTLNRDFLARVREVATPRQWKLMNYQVPTEADEKASAAMMESRAPEVRPASRGGRLYLGAAGAAGVVVLLGAVAVVARARRAALRRR